MQVNLSTETDEVAFGMEMPPRIGEHVWWGEKGYVVVDVTWEIGERGVQLVTVDLVAVAGGPYFAGVARDKQPTPKGER